MNNKKIALVSDFDGTITKEDFFVYVVDEYFNKEALRPWDEYLAGKKTHFQALKEIFSGIHVSEEEIEKLISKIQIDSSFDDALDLCQKEKIPVYICSAGNDYYIKKLISDKIEKYNITLITNKGYYKRDLGLVMTAPEKDDPYYDKNIGISKMRVVENLKKQDFFVIFAGDGPPDLEPAKIADVVFARKMLLERCKVFNIKTLPFNSFKDVYSYIQELKK